MYGTESSAFTRTLRVLAHTQQQEPQSTTQSLQSVFPLRSGLLDVDSRHLPAVCTGPRTVRSLHSEQQMTEDAMTNEDTTADVRISNWTLATATKPGSRHVYSPSASAAPRVEPETKSS